MYRRRTLLSFQTSRLLATSPSSCCSCSVIVHVATLVWAGTWCVSPARPSYQFLIDQTHVRRQCGPVSCPLTTVGDVTMLARINQVSNGRLWYFAHMIALNFPKRWQQLNKYLLALTLLICHLKSFTTIVSPYINGFWQERMDGAPTLSSKVSTGISTFWIIGGPCCCPPQISLHVTPLAKTGTKTPEQWTSSGCPYGYIYNSNGPVINARLRS